MFVIINRLHSVFYIGLTFLFVLLSSCRQESHHPIQFYYWKGAPVSSHESEQFQHLGSSMLYLRLFDIALENGVPKPQGIRSDFDTTGLHAEIVPVVFITNETWQASASTDLAPLTTHILQLVRSLCERMKLGIPAQLQIDSDWTPSTRSIYFDFLQVLKKQFGRSVTCTLRPHQIKDRTQTGIPPVDKGYLMCYGTTSPLEKQTTNSILDLPLLQNYLASISDYPLPFDIALPLYSWAIVTNHLGQIKLINGISESELDPVIFHTTSPHTYLLADDTFLRGIFLNKGFELKVESVSPELLHQTRTYLNEQICAPYQIIYYHLDSLFLSRFAKNDLL